MAPQANFYSLGKICCGHFKVVAGTILRNKNLNFRAQNTGFPSKFQMKENLLKFARNYFEIIRQIEGRSALLRQNVNKLSRTFSPFFDLREFLFHLQRILSSTHQSRQIEQLDLCQPTKKA